MMGTIICEGTSASSRHSPLPSSVLTLMEPVLNNAGRWGFSKVITLMNVVESECSTLTKPHNNWCVCLQQLEEGRTHHAPFIDVLGQNSDPNSSLIFFFTQCVVSNNLLHCSLVMHVKGKSKEKFYLMSVFNTVWKTGKPQWNPLFPNLYMSSCLFILTSFINSHFLLGISQSGPDRAAPPGLMSGWTPGLKCQWQFLVQRSKILKYNNSSLLRHFCLVCFWCVVFVFLTSFISSSLFLFFW